VAQFNWFTYAGIEYKTSYLAANVVVTAGIVAFSLAARAALGKGEAAIVPAGSLSLKGLTEAVVELVDGMVKMVLGEKGRIYLPLFGAIFFYILLNNLFGLVPGMTSATANINLAFAVGLFSFVVYNAIGLKHGGWHYVAHFAGPIWWLAPLMIPIEIISHAVRPLSLGMRLSINMSADHTILGTFLELTKVVVPVIFYGMGTFVSFVQAFVFTMLSMVYVMMATSDDH
jgi:F-type H+-transporting ATPase subunit a